MVSVCNKITQKLMDRLTEVTKLADLPRSNMGLLPFQFFLQFQDATVCHHHKVLEVLSLQ